MKILVDSSAWIEYLEGSEAGERVSQILKNEEIYSINLIIAEVVSKIKRNNQDFNLAYKIISSNSMVFDLNPRIAKEAGLIHAEIKKKVRNFGLIDAIILSSAKKLNAKILTNDTHFEGFKETILIK